MNKVAKLPPPDINTKYLGAWSEINTRIQCRDNVFLAFLSLTTILLGIALSKEDLSFAGIGVGYAALATALIIYQHERVIGYLSEFQRKVAQSGEQNDSYTEWISEEYVFKRISSRYARCLAHLITIVFGSIASLYIAKKSISDPLGLKTWLWFGSVLCSIVAAILVVVVNFRRRYWVKSKR